jgi:hypothetical protein
MKSYSFLLRALIFGAMSVAVLATDITSGLVARYDFDGNATDSSGNNNHASPAGSYSFIAGGHTNSAIHINGDGALFYSGGGFVGLPQFGPALNQGVSVSLWVKDESIGTDPVGEEQYVSLGAVELPQIGISLNRNNPNSPTLTFFLDPVGTGSHPGIVFFTQAIPDLAAYSSSWKHLVLVYEPGRFAAFVNGVKIGEGAGTFTGFPVATAALGRHWWSAGGASSARMSATFDDVLIYNRALSDAEVSQLYTGADPCEEQIAQLEAEIAALQAEKEQLQQQLASAKVTIDELQHSNNLITISLSLLQSDLQREFRDPAFQLPGDSLAAQVDRLVRALLTQNRGQKQALYKELKK